MKHYLRPAALMFLGACAAPRVLRLENEALHQQSELLEAELRELAARAPPTEDYAPRVDHAVLRMFLDRTGRAWSYRDAQAAFRVEAGEVRRPIPLLIRYFREAQVVSVATEGFLDLDRADTPADVVALLIQVATLNFDHLSAKFHVDPETGAIEVSCEIPVNDGLGYATFAATLERVARVADQRYPELDVAAGSGRF